MELAMVIPDNGHEENIQTWLLEVSMMFGLLGFRIQTIRQQLVPQPMEDLHMEFKLAQPISLIRTLQITPTSELWHRLHLDHFYASHGPREIMRQEEKLATIIQYLELYAHWISIGLRQLELIPLKHN